MTPEEAAAAFTELYRTPNGTMQLRPLQGRCMFQSFLTNGRLFTNASVGLGKGLLVAMLMADQGGERPMILTASSIIPQLRNEINKYRAHFKIPANYRLESFENISTNPDLLDKYRPTWLGIDEAHKIKPAKDSGRGKRMARFRANNPHVPIACMSGSPGKDFGAYAHQILWVAPQLGSDRGGPIPVCPRTGLPQGKEFKAFVRLLEEDEDFNARFFARLENTPGIAISNETFLDLPLEIKWTLLETPPEMEEHWNRLRFYGEAPDEWLLEGPGEQWQTARFMGNGLYLRHHPRPEEDWRAARSAWGSEMRAAIEVSQTWETPLDTPKQVIDAINAGRFHDASPLVRHYRAWVAIKDTYTYEEIPEWLSDHVLNYAKAWGKERAQHALPRTRGAIIWVAQKALGHRLSRETGWPFYADDARNKKRQHVSKASAPVIICSVNSCGTGNNLQRYSWNLFLSPPSNNDSCEQWFGRTHRSMQLADRVHIELLITCLEDWAAIHKSLHEAERAEKELRAPRKLLLADHIRARYPTSDESGYAWKKANDQVTVDVDGD